MEASVKIEGLEDAMKAMMAAFPSDPRTQVRILNSAMRTAARPTILPAAKALAMQGDGSGALSEAMGVRSQSAAKRRARGVAGGVEVVPVRSNRKAMMMYIQHYYVARGRTPPAGILTSGIRHGHLVEFGSVNNSARPFLWPAATSNRGAYQSQFAASMKRVTEAAVRREASKRGK